VSPLLKYALDAAVQWHMGQARKYPGVTVPYASHVAGVALLLAKHGFDDEVCAAGALHDVIEDCGVTRDTLAERFGARVATLVAQVSEDDKSLPWEERKARYLEHFGAKPWEAQAISVADKTDNLWSIVVCSQHFGDPWAMFKRGKEQQLPRFQALLDAAKTRGPHPLIAELEQALAAAAIV
jgi:(p)ppGpp synthase/HD superfamily hydrolase